MEDRPEWMLTEEQVNNICTELIKDTASLGDFVMAGARAAQRKLIKWLYGKCVEHDHPLESHPSRYYCYYCICELEALGIEEVE